MSITKRPAFVDLRLTSPRQQAPAAGWVQELLNERVSTKYMPTRLTVDGEFGPATATEAEELMYRLGSPIYRPALSTTDLAILYRWGTQNTLPSGWGTRGRARKAIGYKRGWGVTAQSWAALHPAPKPYNCAAAADFLVGGANAHWTETDGDNICPPLRDLGIKLGVDAVFYRMGYAWCAYTYYLAQLYAGSTVARMGLIDNIFWPLYTPTILDMARRGQHGHKLESAATVRKGHGVLFTFGSHDPVQHIGTFLGFDGGQVVTVDGNTGLTSQDNGGAVMVRKRPLSTVVAFFSIL